MTNLTVLDLTAPMILRRAWRVQTSFSQAAAIDLPPPRTDNDGTQEKRALRRIEVGSISLAAGIRLMVFRPTSWPRLRRAPRIRV